MKRKIGVLLFAGSVSGLVVLAVVFLRSQSGPSDSKGAPSMREYYLERAERPLNQDPRDPVTLPAARRPDSEFEALVEERRELDETVWAKEVAAQKHEETIVKYWDRMLRPEDDKFAVLAEIPFETITLDAPGETTELDWGIKQTDFAGPWKTLDRNGWRQFLKDMEKDGHVIDAVEFHQSEYKENPGENAVSVFDVLLNVTSDGGTLRRTIQSKLRVEWTGETDDEGLYVPGALTVFDTRILEREGPEVFEHRVLQHEIYHWSYPVVYDLDRDGFSDILFPAQNLVMMNRGDGEFDDRTLFLAPGVAPPEPVWTAIAADFDRDGYVDLLCSGRYKSTPASDSSPPTPGVYLFRGDAKGQFVTPGERVATVSRSLISPWNVTAGDIDADGDLDVWLAQYKTPYTEGQMPTPFYDANDGYPSYLLLNRGDGTFEDATKSAGLAKKRHRRTFASSFVDLDGDHDLDLLVTSDFAGTDVYYNDGTGHFTDETDAVLDEANNFGMGHTFADFNRDGALDFYVIGMASTTMRRLNQMGLFRADQPEYLEMRTRMGYGNRMYLSRGARAFRQPDYKDSLARSGWAWGTTSFDFDSDGDMDVYVANGHVSGETTKDYCTRFWCHDIYTGNSQPNKAILNLFATTVMPDRPNEANLSWDGFQKNHLFMNQSGDGFVNVAFLMNAALLDDGRSVISDDFNNDGRPDLLVTSRTLDFESHREFDTAHLLINRWPIENNWIGVRLQIEPGGPSTIGAVIRVRSELGEQLAHIVTGDSFRAQHAPMKHFGLGSDTGVQSIEVQWPDGSVEVLEDPAINTYHVLSSSNAR